MGSFDEDERNFRFNDTEFSDRILLLEITPVLPSNMSDDSNASEVGANDSKQKKIHILTLMLAYNSQFFYKLFKNGMKETHQRDEVSLKINESEEAAFMDVLKFMYDHSVNASSATDLVDVVMAADKFEVPSCLKYCVELLLKLPMSTELAVYFLGLLSTVLADEVVQPLIVSAESYIDAHFRDFTQSQEEAMGLTLGALELVLGRDNLQVDSEEVVFDFILKWGRHHYPEQEERRDVLTKLLLKFVCLPKMSSLKLKEVIDCSDFNSEKVCRPVINALFYKDPDVPMTTNNHPRRMYNLRDIKVVQHQQARPQRVVYFDITKKECADLVPGKRLYSQVFCLGGKKISLFVTCIDEPRSLCLNVHVMEGIEERLVYYFSVMKKPAMEFISVRNTEFSLSISSTQEEKELDDLFNMPWKKFMGAQSPYFIDGVLHFRADIAFKR